MKRLLLILLCTTGPLWAFELNFDTHFDHEGTDATKSPWNHNIIAPFAAKSGATWVRDNTNWVAIENAGQGVYGQGWFAQYKIPWMVAAHKAGLKVVGCVDAGNGQSPTWYPNQFDPTAYAKACAWLATATATDPATGIVYPLVDAIEILNEPNNIFAHYYGGQANVLDASQWQAKYVTLLNTAYAAIKTANPNMPVIGLGAQGSDNLYMIGLGVQVDGITYHPYDDGSHIPERVYEPTQAYKPWTGYPYYEPWVAAVRAARPNTPIWETEKGPDYGDSEYQAAVWNARRYLITFGLNVEHTFFYELIGDGEFSGVGQSWISFFDYPRQSAYVLPRIIDSLEGYKGSAAQISIGSPPANFKSYVFQNDAGQMQAAVWIGNVAPYKAPDSPAAIPCAFSVPMTQNHQPGGALLNAVTGELEPILEVGTSNPNNAPQWTDAAGGIKNVPVSEQPQIITFVAGFSAPAPTPTPTPTPSPTPVPTPTPNPLVQTNYTQYGPASTTSLSCTWTNPNKGGDRIVVNIKSPVAASQVGDGAGNTYTKITTASGDTETWQATNIANPGWRTSVYVNFSAPAYAPYMKITEYTP